MKMTHVITLTTIAAITFIVFVALQPESKGIDMTFLSYLSISTQK